METLYYISFGVAGIAIVFSIISGIFIVARALIKGDLKSFSDSYEFTRRLKKGKQKNQLNTAYTVFYFSSRIGFIILLFLFLLIFASSLTG